MAKTMEELLASLPAQINTQKGQTVTGKVISVNDKEVVLDLGTKSEGILSLRDLVGKEVKVGDSLEAVVLEPETESGVLLTIQRSRPEVAPRNSKDNEKWTEISGKYSKDDILKGKVAKITEFGIFVTLEEGIEGLIHVSKLGPDDNFEVGQSVSVSVDSIDTEKRRISLVPVITSTKGLIYK